MQNRFSNDSFNQLVSKLFSCNFVLIVSENAQHFSRLKFDDNFDNILNQFSSLSKLNLTIRDLCGHNAYALNTVELRFADWTVLKARPNAAQIKKLQFDLISSMSQLLYTTSDETTVDESVFSSTAWYQKWKHFFIDTFELSEQDFIGTNFGCFFVITDQELENFKDIFANLVTQVKHQTWIRWLQPDFVRYYLVLSEQSLQTHISMNTPKASLYRELQSIYPNSYWLQIDSTTTVVANDVVNEEVFCDNNKQSVVKTDSTDNCNYLPPFDVSGDPLNVSFNSKLNNNERHSSGSDQSLQNSVQSLNLNDLSERYLQTFKPKTTFEGMAAIFDSMLKEFITKTLIPWAEKQIKLLGEAIAQRKGFRRSIFSATKSLINNMSSSTVGLKAQSMSQSVVYLPEAPEMQLRKLGDLSMCLTMYELAYNSFYAAKKDFQSESAWLYYAAASEASAIASYYTNKFQRHYFEQSINCYVDTCRAMSLATRATILATEASRQLWPNESANLFIRMTGDDSDLRSALFLEQASKCFLEAGHRTRKSAFHYVLAGHRYNRCGLKHFALACYRRFSCVQWTAATDHVNLTVARLFLSIANTNQSLSLQHRAQGLEILRANANKSLFFQEFIRETKRDLESVQTNGLQQQLYYYLDLPSILSVDFDPIEGFGQQKGPNCCFVGEELLLKLRLRTPFQLVLHQLKFFTTNTSVNCPAITSSIDSDEDVIIYLSVVPQIECDFDLLGLEYKCEDLVQIKCRFDEKILNRLTFRSVKTLPAIVIDVQFQTPVQTFQTSNPIEVYANEIIDLTIGLNCAHNEWKPSSLVLSTNAVLLNNSFELLANSTDIGIDFDSQNAYKIQMPADLGQHIINFKLTYTDDINICRVINKTITFEIKECLVLETNIESVVSLKNSSNTDPVFVKSSDNILVEVPPNLTAHLLSNGLVINWSQPNGRYGVIRL